MLASYTDWAGDGTFSTAPKLFKQLYFVGIHTKEGKFIPAAYGMLTNKSAETYREFFTAIADYVGQVEHVEKFSCDFEQAVHTVVEELFPNVAMSGCMFHFKKAIFDNVRQKKCTPVYNNVAAFRTIISNIYALAYVPSQEVARIWEEVIQPMAANTADEWTGENGEGYGEEVQDYLDYVDRTWIGKKLQHGCRAPLFPLAAWNKYTSILAQDFVVTNNGNEAFNSTWNPSVPKRRG